MDTFLSLLQNHSLYLVMGVVIGVGAVLIVGRPSRLRQIHREIAPQDSMGRLNDTLKILRDDDRPLEDAGKPIPPTLRGYKTSSGSLNNLGQSFLQGYRNRNPFRALILGESGIGKSTLLHQYALDFMDKELDEADPEKIGLPIFVPLHKWAKRKQPFNVFLLNYLMQLKTFPWDRSLLYHWINKGKLMLLLDGLDEMDKEDAKKCIEALNNFSGSPFIVSCRIAFYETLLSEQTVLKVREIAVIQRPQPKLAQKYLNREGAARLSSILYSEDRNRDNMEIDEKSHILEVLAQSFPDILNQDEIAFTPLMLKMLAQTFPDTSDWQYSLLREKEIWKIYTREIIRSKSKEGYYSEEYLSRMWHWLTQLARYMGELPLFYFRPTNLPDRKKILYAMSTWLIILLLGGAASLLAIFGRLPLWELLPMIAIIEGFYGYLRKSVLTGIYMTVLYILALSYPFVAVAATQEKRKLHRVREVLTTLALVFILPVLLRILAFMGTQMIGIPFWPGLLVAGVAVLLIEGLLWYTFYRLGNLQVLQPIANDSPAMETFFGYVYSLIANHIDPLAPDIFASKISISSMKVLALSIAVGLAIGMSIWLAGCVFWRTNLLLVAILLGISIWLDMGPGADIRGSLLRFWFYRSEILPWKATFLDDAVACSLLRQEEDCFTFFHGTPMQEYFRSEPSPPPSFSSKVLAERPPDDASRDEPLEVFCWCAYGDEKWHDHLRKYLKPLEKRGEIRIWSAFNLQAGDQKEEVIRAHLVSADIILLLVSPDFLNFLASDGFQDGEMTRAIQRHDEGSTFIHPVYLRSTLWKGEPFEKLMSRGAAPVSQHPNLDDAFNDIVREVMRIVAERRMLKDEA